MLCDMTVADLPGRLHQVDYPSGSVTLNMQPLNPAAAVDNDVVVRPTGVGPGGFLHIADLVGVVGLQIEGAPMATLNTRAGHYTPQGSSPILD